MANPFLIGDTTSTFTDNKNTFNPFVTSTSAELETNNDNPFFSTIGSINSVQDNTNPFLSFIQKPEPPYPVADLLGFNEKFHSTVIEQDATKIKPPPPRPAPPKRPPPRPAAPLHDAKELILSVTGEMDATSLHLLDRLAKTPSPTPMRDLLSPSPTPIADLLGCEDLQPPITSQTTNLFDQHSNIIDLPTGPKPERPKLPPKIDFLMDDLLEDVPINEGLHSKESLIQQITPSIPENISDICEFKSESRISSNEFIPSARRLSHDVTESRKIMPDLSKISDRRKSDIGHFAPILPSRKPVSQSDQSLQESKSDYIIQEMNESEEKSSIDVFNNLPKETLLPTNIQEYNVKEESFPTSPLETNVTWEEEKNELDFDSQQNVEFSNHMEISTTINDSPFTTESLSSEPTIKENVTSNTFDVDMNLPSSESFPLSIDEEINKKLVDTYEVKPLPSVSDSSPFQEKSSQETPFNAMFETDQIVATLIDVQKLQQSDSREPTVSQPTPESTTFMENDAFDAFEAKFDDSQNDFNASGGAFDAFGGVSGGVFEDSTVGFGTDDNFDSFLTTHPIPAAPQSTPAKVTRNNSGESLDENDFNVFIRYSLFIYNFLVCN